MAALESLFDDGPRERVVVPRRMAPVLPLLPLLPQPDEPRPEQRPHRHLFVNERGDDWQAEHQSWRHERERDVTVYGERDVSTRQGWATKDVA